MTYIKGEVRDEKQYVLFKIQVSYSVDVLYQGEDNLLKLRNQVWQELPVLANFSDYVPTFVYEQLDGIRFLDLNFDMA